MKVAIRASGAGWLWRVSAGYFYMIAEGRARSEQQAWREATDAMLAARFA